MEVARTFIKINGASRTRCSTSHQRAYGRLRHAIAKWCTAEPGPRLIREETPGSRVCSTSFRFAHAALRPGHEFENPKSFPVRL
ncbi:MAG: hypothetical protein OJF62_001735 [Pseudolabrys sp.]|nr:hypothetical protein [Pseudolabrys sp.]